MRMAILIGIPSLMIQKMNDGRGHGLETVHGPSYVRKLVLRYLKLLWNSTGGANEGAWQNQSGVAMRLRLKR